MKTAPVKVVVFLIAVALVIAVAAGCASDPAARGPFHPEEELARQEFGEDPDGAGDEEEQEEAEAGKGEENGEPGEDEKEAGEKAASDQASQESTSAPSGSGSQGGSSSGKSSGSASSGGGGSSAATATVSIRGPSDMGVILSPTRVTLEQGDSALEVLRRACRQQGIHLDYRGRGSSAYVEGIRNLYEFDRGPESGWMYSVNGYFPSRGSGAWTVEAGDRVEWFYTTNSGRDLGVKPGG